MGSFRRWGGVKVNLEMRPGDVKWLPHRAVWLVSATNVPPCNTTTLFTRTSGWEDEMWDEGDLIVLFDSGLKIESSQCRVFSTNFPNPQRTSGDTCLQTTQNDHPDTQ
jgi:hypothetical protein